MNLKELKDDINYYSGKASEIARYLALSGFGVIWITKNGDTFNQLALNALFMFALSLAIDFLHYFVASIGYEILRRYKEYKNDNADFKINKYVNLFFWFTFLMKSFTMIIGYYYLLKFLFIAFKL